MKILVTGANGYLGQGVVKALLDNGHSVVAADFKTNYVDTENTKIEPFDKGGVTGYFFQKDGMSYICFERDGCFFSVYGSIDTDELAKIAASITKK